MSNVLKDMHKMKIKKKMKKQVFKKVLFKHVYIQKRKIWHSLSYLLVKEKDTIRPRFLCTI